MKMKRFVSLSLAALICASGAAALQVSAAETPQETNVIAFGDMEKLVRENNKNVLACLESRAGLDAFDRKLAYDALVDAYNNIGRMDVTGAMASTLSSLDEQIDALEESEYAESYEDSVRELENVVNTFVGAAEDLYMTVYELENSLAKAKIGLETLDRNVRAAEAAEMLGQMSGDALRTLKEQRANTASAVAELEAAVKSCKESLEYMIGREPTGKIELADVEIVHDEMIAQIDLTADLEAGMEKSLAVYQAERTAEDAMEDYYDTHGGRYLNTMAKHTMQSAQQSALDAKESYRVAIRAAYDTLKEKDRLRDTAADTLAYQQRNSEIAQRKYELGMIGREELLTAQGERDLAQLALDQAEANCMAAYRKYCWAAAGVA